VLDVLIGLHSLWRWVVLLVVTVAMVRGFVGWLRGGDWTSADRSLSLVAITSLDIQLLLGLIVYGVGQRWGASNFIAYIHPLVMIVAIAVAHIASVRARRETAPAAKHRTLALGLLLTLFLVTAAIPTYSWSRAWYA
jgi:hypothetical protein